MSLSTEKIYQLLPAFYRIEDAKKGEPLKALLQLLSEQAGILEKDISQLYRNWFIETCEEWVVPYIGDLLGVKGAHSVSDSTYSLRSFVANTLRYRRRKGTATMLEQLARDVTGWNARAVEFFLLLGTSQYINHLRLHNHRTPDLRKSNSLELLDTPFDSITHTVDVRHIKSGRGKHNIANIGIFLWRLQAFPAEWSPAFFHQDGKFSFSPLGNDIPLFNHPETEKEITHLAEEVNVPSPIRRIAFKLNKTMYYDKECSICIRKDNNIIPENKIVCCNLSEWKHRPEPGKIAIDPVLGRLAFPVGENLGSAKIEVRYHYGFSSEVGGGWYQKDFKLSQKDTELYKISGQNPDFNKIKDAYDFWKTNSPGKNAIIQINDSRAYSESLDFVIPAGKSLEVRGAQQEFPLLKLKNVFKIEGKKNSRLILNGLRICSQPLNIKKGDLASLVITHCTLVPGLELDIESRPKQPNKLSLTAANGNLDLKVTIYRSISGGIKLQDSHDLEIRESIVQGLNKKAVEGPCLQVASSTLLGAVSVRQMVLASNTIFTEPVTAELTQKGCVRFCFVTENSIVPRHYRCQPDLTIDKAIEAAKKIQSPLSDPEKQKIATAIRLWLKPVFTEVIYSKPGFAQLSKNCPQEIKEGAEEGDEVGVFQHLHQPQRLDNLRSSLEEYLPAGMEAGIFFVN